VSGSGGRDLARLYEQHAPAALRLAYLLTGDRERAEALVQDAFVRVVGRFGQLRGDRSLDARLRRTVVDLSCRRFRPGGSAARDVAEESEDPDQLWHRLGSLAPRQRAALVLLSYEELSEEQAAQVLRSSTWALRSLTSRGLQSLAAPDDVAPTIEDLGTRLRETLDRHADRAVLRPMTPALLVRTRRRRVRALAASLVSLVVLAGIGAWSVQTATAEPVRPVHRVVVPDPDVRNGDLAYVAGPLDEARLVIRHPDGSVSSIDRTRFETEPCTPFPVVTMIDGTPRCGGFGSLVWAPDGGRLAFVFAHRSFHPGNAPTDLYVVRADGSGLRKIAACPMHRGILPCDLTSAAGPTWSPDGSQIAVSGDGRIWTAALDGGGFRPLTECPPCSDSHPDWSPDGRSIAFARDDGVYEVSVADGSTWRLASLQGVKAPAWSPDGTQVAILAEGGVYVLDGVRGDGVVRRVAEITGPQWVSVPTWSPDGRTLAWLVEADSRAMRLGHHVDLWTTRLDGAPPARVVQAPCCLATDEGDARLAWSPDGRKIALHQPGRTTTLAPQGVLVVDVATARLRRFPGGDAAWPAWQPVG
jgi:DNA-directed RNA polymerase specialized sigma24 family protein/Tol biopolymer transport system component